MTDSEGRRIDDLTAGDFEVLENGQPRPLASVRRLVSSERRRTNAVTPVSGARMEALATNVGVADAPAFVLVRDDLNTSPYDAHRVIRAGLGVLGAIPPDALVAIVTTSGEGGSLLTLSPPTAEHAAQVREFRGRVLLTGASRHRWRMPWSGQVASRWVARLTRRVSRSASGSGSRRTAATPPALLAARRSSSRWHSCSAGPARGARWSSG